LGLTGAAAYLVWRMKSQKPAVVTQSITAPVTRPPVSTAVVPEGSGQPTMPIWTTPNVPAPAQVGSRPLIGSVTVSMPPTEEIMPPFPMSEIDKQRECRFTHNGYAMGSEAGSQTMYCVKSDALSVKNPKVEQLQEQCRVAHGQTPKPTPGGIETAMVKMWELQKKCTGQGPGYRLGRTCTYSCYGRHA
jgi:hypothetical protein